LKVFVSMMGILVIGLALAASFGLCFYMQIFFADMHPIIPFLLLGIGVDDMFVIVQVRGSLPTESRLNKAG
jgi:Niemann-Pick C1 protein